MGLELAGGGVGRHSRLHRLKRLPVLVLDRDLRALGGLARHRHAVQSELNVLGGLNGGHRGSLMGGLVRLRLYLSLQVGFFGGIESGLLVRIALDVVQLFLQLDELFVGLRRKLARGRIRFVVFGLHLGDRLLDQVDRLADRLGRFFGRGLRIVRQLLACDFGFRRLAGVGILDPLRRIQRFFLGLLEIILLALVAPALGVFDDPVRIDVFRRVFDFPGKSVQSGDQRIGFADGGILRRDNGGVMAAVVGRRENERTVFALVRGDNVKLGAGFAVGRGVASAVGARDGVALAFGVDDVPLVGELVGGDQGVRHGRCRNVGVARVKMRVVVVQLQPTAFAVDQQRL